MKLSTNRLLIATLLLMPGMVIAKPAPKKGPPKPLPAAAAPATGPAAPATPPAPPPPPYNPGYGMAGCGLGAELIKEDSFIQIFAATTNGTVWSQSFGISFGTLHCTPSNKAVALEQKVFIEANLVSLKREAVAGQGETLTAFADLLGCQTAQFSQVSKDNYQQIYKASEADQILQGYKAVLSTQCTRLI
ncbi:MAG: DUF3015 family protein [Chitinophagaceae bacterium]|nr:DUF3015 family protein [Oligoflexus sp.]